MVARVTYKYIQTKQEGWLLKKFCYSDDIVGPRPTSPHHFHARCWYWSPIHQLLPSRELSHLRYIYISKRERIMFSEFLIDLRRRLSLKGYKMHNGRWYCSLLLWLMRSKTVPLIFFNFVKIKCFVFSFTIGRYSNLRLQNYYIIS